MDRAQLTEKPLNANQGRSSRFVCPEVPRTSCGADASAVVALRAPLHHFVVPDLTLGPNKGVEEVREDPDLIKQLRILDSQPQVGAPARGPLICLSVCHAFICPSRFYTDFDWMIMPRTSWSWKFEKATLSPHDSRRCSATRPSSRTLHRRWRDTATQKGAQQGS